MSHKTPEHVARAMSMDELARELCNNSDPAVRVFAAKYLGEVFYPDNDGVIRQRRIKAFTNNQLRAVKP